MSISRQKRNIGKIGKELIELFNDKAEKIEFSMGQVILGENSKTSHVYLLLSGRFRQLTRDSRNEDKTLTIATHEEDFAGGWASILSGRSIEILTAAEDSEVLKIESTTWRKAIESSSTLTDKYINGVTISDLWPLVSNNPNLHLPSQYREMRSWIRRLAEEAITTWVEPGAPTSQPLDEKYHWMIASENNSSFGYGVTVASGDLPLIQSQVNNKLRLIGIPETVWLRYPSLKEQPTQALQDQNIRKSDKKEHANGETNVSQDPEELDASGFRFFDSKPGDVPETIACFKTVCHQLRVPLKIEALEKVLEQQTKKSDSRISLQLCAALAESLGLKTQLLDVPVDVISRIKTPSIVHFGDGELCVALATRRGQILLSRPRSGIEAIEIANLKDLCIDSDVISILTLERTERTPEKKFGLEWFIPAVKKNKRPLLEVLIASLFVQLFQLMNPLIVQQIVDKVIGQNGINTLPVLTVLLISCSIFENILTAVRTNLFIDTTNRIDVSLGEEVIDHLLRLPLGYFDKRPVGDLSSRIGELEKIRSFLTGTALTVVMDAVFSIIYIAVMIFYSWMLTIVALLVAPILGFLTFAVSPVIRKQLRSKAEKNATTQNHLIEVLTGIHTVKAQNFELKARWKWKERYSSYVSEGFKNAVTSTTTNALVQFLNQLSALSIISVGAYLVLNGELTLGGLIAFRIISGYVTAPILRLSNLYQNFQQTTISLERLADIVNTPQESTDLDKKQIPLAPIKGKIVYDSVSFRFGKSGPLQLSQVSLEINPGEFVAIVGQSGSGKSTLTKLLPRLYEPLSGTIMVDNMDISKVELYSLRRQIGIVPQESLLFEGSVNDNICLSNPEATSEEVISAAKIACAHEFIMSLPSGYASPVGERGGGLSGGQRQRIAIARTVLQNPELLIMDEATSALDYQTERLVSLNLMNHFRGKTVLFITHRLNSVVHADKIVLMHEGVVDEIGTHEELMEIKGRYSSLFNQQGGGDGLDNN